MPLVWGEKSECTFPLVTENKNSTGGDNTTVTNPVLYLLSNICVGEEPGPEFSNVELEYLHIFDYDSNQEMETCTVPEFSSVLYYMEETTNENTSTNKKLCGDQYSFMKINVPAPYEDHHHYCQLIQATLPTREDLILYSAEITSTDETCRTDNRIVTWVDDPQNDEDSDTPWCSIFTSDWATDIRPCYHALKCAICKFRTSLPVRLYGNVEKYDNNYTLLTKHDSSFYLKGQESSLVRYVDNKWTLQSNLHMQTCHVNTTAGPFLRLNWMCKNETKMLTFTSCSSDSFACTTGKCIPESYRCDGIVQCHDTDDSSDEDECELFQKAPGYDISKFPPPAPGEKTFNVKYKFYIYSIDDIKTVDYSAYADMVIGIMWRDERLTIWNPIPYQEVKCGNIWSPIISAADTYPQGHMAPLPDEFKDDCLVLLKNQKLRKSLLDPYMG